MVPKSVARAARADSVRWSTWSGGCLLFKRKAGKAVRSALHLGRLWRAFGFVVRRLELAVHEARGAGAEAPHLAAFAARPGRCRVLVELDRRGLHDVDIWRGELCGEWGQFGSSGEGGATPRRRSSMSCPGMQLARSKPR